MLLLRLDLERYGAFENVSLAFRPDARLHVVFGANEAGKSSALAAVSDLLFGFGHLTDFAFRFPTGQLRLGASIRGRDGTELAFCRLKRQKGSLVDAEDRPLPDDLLAPFLGALGRETFERAFGLDALALRQGGEDLRRADGETGASLFAAASGLRGLDELRRSVEDEADALFRPQAQKRRFNEELQRFETARREVAANELGESRWKRLNDEIASLEARHAALKDRRLRAGTERARLDRLMRARAAAVALDLALADRDAFGAAPELEAAVVQDLAGRLALSEQTAEAVARAAAAFAAAEAECGGLTTDPAALDSAAEIEGLIELSGAYAKSQLDLPKVRREADILEDRLAGLAQRLGLRDASAIEAAAPSDAARATVRDLILERRELAQGDAAREKALEEAEERLRTLQAASGGDSPDDPRSLMENFFSLKTRLNPYERRVEWGEEHDREGRSLANAAARMAPAADLERLSARTMPGPETIAIERKRRERFSADLARVEEAIVKESGDLARIEAEIAALFSAGSIASPEAIAAAREARAAAWGPLRAHLLDETDLGSAERATGAAALDRATLHADKLADRAALDAGRAAEQAGLARRRAEHEAALGALRGRLDALREDREAAALAWAEAWEPSGVTPASPEEMEGWRKELTGLLDRAERNAERGAAVARLDRLADALRPELAALAASCGIKDAETADIVDLQHKTAARLAALNERHQAASLHAAGMAEVSRAVEKLGRDREAAARKAAASDARWSGALPALGLAPEATLGAVEAALDAWGEAPSLLDQLKRQQRRVERIEEDAAAFRGLIASLASALAPELSDFPPEVSARRLNERLVAARAAKVRHDDAARRLAELRVVLEGARRAERDAAEALAVAARDLPPDADLTRLIARMSERDRLSAIVMDRRAEFLRAADATDEAATRAELAAFDVDAAPATIDALRTEEDHAVSEAEQVYAALATERARRDALGGAEAETAAARQRAAGAALAATAREWAVLKASGILLGAAIERARAADRSPTLDRAAALFSLLTGGAFSGFAQDFEKDQPVLVGRRASGEALPVRGMSEGTRDQFYLALRLAVLEDYASRAEPAPFLGDDLFASFDDARTAHGLKALAEIGERVQPILFTHHRSVLEIAQRTLGQAVDVIELGGSAR